MKPLIFISAVLTCSAIQAQDVTLAGSLPSIKNGKLELSNLDEQKWSIETDASGNFNQTIKGIQAGYYTLSDVGTVYLSPGYSLNITKKNEQLVMQGIGSKENNLIQQLNATSKKVAEKMNKGDFNFVKIPDFRKQMEAFRKSQYALLNRQKPDQQFQSTRKADIDYTIRNLYTEYGYKYGVDMKKQENFFRFMESMGTNYDSKKLDSAYKAMQTWKLTREQRNELDSIGDLGGSFNEEEVFKGSAAYRKWMDNQFTGLMYSKYSKDLNSRMSQEAIKQKAVAEAVSNPYIKNYWHYRFASQALKTSEDLQEADSIYQAFKSTNSHPAFASVMEKAYERIKKYTKGAPAPEFEYQTVAGEKVKLSSLRGNFVYIDVWATWCGPCKAEIPNLKKVEEHYRDKNIKFVSISVDELKDAQKWKDYVINNELKGVQLMSDNAFNSSFIQDFNIISIPRFILIDTEGKIISANAYRPSNKLLRTQLDTLLAAQQ